LEVKGLRETSDDREQVRFVAPNNLKAFHMKLKSDARGR